MGSLLAERKWRWEGIGMLCGERVGKSNHGMFVELLNDPFTNHEISLCFLELCFAIFLDPHAQKASLSVFSDSLSNCEAQSSP